MASGNILTIKSLLDPTLDDKFYVIKNGMITHNWNWSQSAGYPTSVSYTDGYLNIYHGQGGTIFFHTDWDVSRYTKFKVDGMCTGNVDWGGFGFNAYNTWPLCWMDSNTRQIWTITGTAGVAQYPIFYGWTNNTNIRVYNAWYEV